MWGSTKGMAPGGPEVKRSRVSDDLREDRVNKAARKNVQGPH